MLQRHIFFVSFLVFSSALEVEDRNDLSYRVPVRKVGLEMEERLGEEKCLRE